MTDLELVIQGPDGTTFKHALAGRSTWLGRAAECDVVLTSGLVSRRHACLELEGDLLQLRDASSNGTLVDGVRVQNDVRALVPPADFEIGTYRVHVAWARSATRAQAPIEVAVELRRRIHRRLLDRMDLAQLDRRTMDAEALRPKVRSALQALCDELSPELPSAELRARLVGELCDEVLGLGPLEALLADPAVSEVMVVDPATIFAERAGRIEHTSLRFTDGDAARAVIERIVTPLGRRVDESNPLVDARLPDGSRVNAVIPPLARRGPCITIRKFGGAPLSIDALVERGSLDVRMARFLFRAVRARRNLVVSGGTGSGKTTLLNVLSGAVPDHERIVTIEDAAELRLRQPHVVALEARPPNLEGRGEVSIRDLVKNALRMRPDRILVGECRGGEAVDMLQAMNTGHEGSMTTTHANSPREAIARLETLCLMAGIDLPLRAIRSQLATSVHLIVQQTR
ncbi:MAG TPA: ATPase, T2SS/T4P/T4SS family, partial [Polyangiales bacterium]|nr:ATPase, T2SS/T4P/T4SS family [Polyangiales bacterium]